jgi:hypothetical protein
MQHKEVRLKLVPLLFVFLRQSDYVVLGLQMCRAMPSCQFFFVALGFEFRCLLGRSSKACGYFGDGVIPPTLLPGLALNCDFPDVCLSSS